MLGAATAANRADETVVGATSRGADPLAVGEPLFVPGDAAEVLVVCDDTVADEACGVSPEACGVAEAVCAAVTDDFDRAAGCGFDGTVDGGDAEPDGGVGADPSSSMSADESAGSGGDDEAVESVTEGCVDDVSSGVPELPALVSDATGDEAEPAAAEPDDEEGDEERRESDGPDPPPGADDDFAPCEGEAEDDESVWVGSAEAIPWLVAATTASPAAKVSARAFE